jgi:hypothetical protein
MGDLFVSINEPSTNLNKKKIIHINDVEVINVQQIMLGVVFEAYVMSRYGFYNVAKDGFKYIHYYLTIFF